MKGQNLFLYIVCLCTMVALMPMQGKAENNKSVLIVGDSHTAQSFGTMMQANFMYDGYKTATYGSCGSSPLGWLSDAAWAMTKCGHYEAHPSGKTMRAAEKKTPNFLKLLKNISPELSTPTAPDIVIIALGANQINSIETDATFSAQKKTVIRMIEGVREINARCFWVGPPDGDFKKKPKDKQDRLYKMLTDAMAETNQYCSFISSRADQVPGGMEYPCSTDGVHMDSCGEGKIMAVRWARYIHTTIAHSLKQE